MATRPTGEFSAASMADIAFLLLIFFLVATTMDSDTVMHRVMSPPSNEPPPEINERNVWVVLVNSKDQLMVEGEQLPITMLKEKTKEFILNPQNKEDLPEKRIAIVEPFGEIEVSKGIISIQNDRETSYGMFIQVMNELVAAGNEVKNEFSIQQFGKEYKNLPDHLQAAVKDAVPTVISESEPKHVNN
ncbi:MAG: biopolymer transporter ExbD [Marinilabiliales bacterium]|mgnify:CR=1 FL=1|nr:MAG: biopolymer transporter ExbD [Marinilabiliales bacterium]